MKKILLAALLFGTANTLFGQAKPIQLFWNQGPPYPYIIEDYKAAYEYEVVATVVNNGSILRRLRLKVHIEGDNGIVIDSDDNATLKHSFDIGPMTTEPLTGRELWDIGIAYDIEDLISKFTISGVNPIVVINNKVLPEGNYMMCLTALDYDTKSELSHPLCVMGSIHFAERPIIVTPPTDDFEVVPTNPSAIPVTWLLPGGPIPDGANLHFTLKIVDLEGLEGMSLQDAINSPGTPAIFEEVFINEFSTQIQLEDIFEIGHRYVMRVVAEDMANPVRVIFQYNGESELRPFFYGSPEDGEGDCATHEDFEADATFPRTDDTIPFLKMPFISKWTPYCNYRELRITNFLLKDLETGDDIGAFEGRNNTWAGDDTPASLTREAIEDFNEKATYPDFDVPEGPTLEFFAQHTALEQPSLQVPLERGKGYAWSADLSMKDRSGTWQDAKPIAPDGSLITTFEVGMTRPFGIEPPQNDQLPLETTAVTLKWKPGNAPTNPFPPFIVLKADYTGPGDDWVEMTRLSPVRERFVVQIMGDSAGFESSATLEHFETGLIEFNTHNSQFQTSRTFEAVRNAFLETLYGQRETVWTNESTIAPGDYFWRIGWQKNPDEIFEAASLPTADKFYRTSEIMKFWVGEAGSEGPPVTENETPPPPYDCLSPCKNAEIADKTAITGLAEGNEIRVGKFKVELTEVAMSGTTASGKCLLLDAPYFRAHIKCTFTGLKVNKDKVAFEGEFEAEKDDAPGFPNFTPGVVTGLELLSNQELDEYDALINSSTRLVSALAFGTETGLPLGIEHEWGSDGQKLTLGIVGIQFSPDTAVMDVVASLNMPEVNNWFALGARGICINPNGMSTAQFELYFPADKVFGDDEEGYTFTLNGSPEPANPRTTKAIFQCKKLTELQIHATLKFNRDHLLPVNSSGEVEESGRVEARFSAIYFKGKGLLAPLSMSRFTTSEGSDWSFEVTEATIDMSDSLNPAGIVFPTSPSYSGLKTNKWKGFYLKKLTVAGPKTFARNQQPVLFGGKDLLISDGGDEIWGTLFGEDILQMNEGSFGGWNASIDDVEIKFGGGSIEKFSIRGRIATPANDTTALPYELLRSNPPPNIGDPNEPGDDINLPPVYSGRIVVPEGGYDIKFWKSNKLKVRMNETSFLEMKTLSGGGWDVLLDMSGVFGADFPTGKKLNFTGVDFEHFKFSNGNLPGTGYEKFLDIGNWSFASPQHSTGGFPFTVESILPTGGEYQGKTEAGIQIEIALNLAGETNVFNASTKISILATLETQPSQHCKYSRVRLDRIAIGGTVGPVEVNGEIDFYEEDAVYGTGFRGGLDATFADKFALNAIFQVGKKAGYRYWMADALITGVDIPLFAGINLKGFGGGVRNHMELTTQPKLDSPGDTTEIGGSLSGAVYKPRENSGGVKATVILGPNTPSTPDNPPSWYADVTLAASWNRANGGLQISEISIEGNLKAMMETMNDPAPPIKGHALIRYDLVNQILDGQFEVDIDAAEHRIVGHGEVHFYFSGDKWFIKIGEPAHKVFVQFKLSEDGPPLVNVGTYYMLGDDLPDFSINDLPQVIRDNLPTEGSPPAGGRDAAVATGSGIAFGASLSVPRKSMNFLFFYAAAEIHFGYDVSLKKYNPPPACPNWPHEFGANGWYGRGRIYGYIGGEFGVRVDVGPLEGSFSIGSVAAGAFLEAGLPSPTWVKGSVWIEYNVLDGAFSGNKKFHFKAGTICDPNALDLLSLELVSQLNPENNATNVDCGAFPQVVFNLPIERELVNSYIDQNGNPAVQRFKILYDLLKFERKLPNNTWLAADMVTAKFEDSKLLEIQPESAMQGQTFYRFGLRVRIEEKRGASWVVVGATVADKYKTYLHTFKTGPYPKTFVDSYLRDTWPRHRQRRYLQDECRNGFIKFRQAWDIFPTSSGGYTWNYMARFRKALGGPLLAEVPVQLYSAVGTNEITDLSFAMPTLPNNTTFALEITGKGTRITGGGGGERYTDAGAPRHGLASVMTVSNDAEGGQARSRDYKSNRLASRADEKIIGKINFRTSEFNTLQAKMADFETTEVCTEAADESITAYFKQGEKFDDYDLKAVKLYGSADLVTLPKLVNIDAANLTSGWYGTFVNPKIMNFWATMHACCSQVTVSFPDPDPPGAPIISTITVISAPVPLPTNRFSLHTGYVQSLLDDDEVTPIVGIQVVMPPPAGGMVIVQAGQAPAPPTVAAVKYDLPVDVRSRYNTFKNQLSHWSDYKCEGPTPPPHSVKCPAVAACLVPSFYKKQVGTQSVTFKFNPPMICRDIDTGGCNSCTKGTLDFRR